MTGVTCCNIYVDYLQENKGSRPPATLPNQTAAIYLSEGVEEVVIINNTFTGRAPDEKRE